MTEHFLVWLRSKGVERITVYGLASEARLRVSQVREILWRENIPEDRYDTTVSLNEVIVRFGLDKPRNMPYSVYKRLTLY